MSRAKGDGTRDDRARMNAFLRQVEFLNKAAVADRLDLATLGTTLNIIRSLENPTSVYVWYDRPPLAELDQAALRIVPFFKNNDDCFHTKFTGALVKMTQHDEEAVRLASRLQKAWKALEDNNRWWETVSGPDHHMDWMSDRKIAWAYIAGELMHNKDHVLQEIRYVTEESKYMAIMALVRDVFIAARATQQYVTDLENEGRLR